MCRGGNDRIPGVVTIQKQPEFIGRRFGRLLALEFVQIKSRRLYRCKCDCGNEKTVREDALTAGLTKSCGCFAQERAFQTNYRHGWSAGRGLAKAHRAAFNTWRSMNYRCYSPTYEKYEIYGRRGITVCDRWRTSFAMFLEDMGDRPDGTTLDRINGSGNYEPGNCRWADAKTQSNNRSIPGYEIGGQTKTVRAWAIHFGIPYPTVQSRMARGLGLVEALTAPRRLKKAA